MAVEASDATLAVLFEGAPAFVSRLAELPTAERLNRAEEVALAMPEAEQVELLNAHPRIGAAPGSVSALSFHEQGYDRDPGTAELQARLDRLNDAYETRHGFRFVVFVNGRPRPVIADLMEQHINAETTDERARGLRDVIAIARDRAAKMRAEEGR